MKSQVFFVALASVATFAFAQDPTPPPPGPDEKGNTKNGEKVSKPLTKSREEAIKIGLMLKSYTDENGGKLPAKLKDLAPAYFNDTAVLEHFELKTPGAKLVKISPKTVVLSDSRDEKNVIFAEQLQRSRSVEAAEPAK